MLELYKNLSYGHKKEVCKLIAIACKRQPESVRNWFIGHKNIPIEFSEIVKKHLELETIKMNIQFCNDPEMIFEMNRKYRELEVEISLKHSILKAKKNWEKIEDIDAFLDEIKGYEKTNSY